jgi:hypothetical protein
MCCVASPQDVEAAASAARDALKMSGGIRMRNILTQRCRLHVKVVIKQFYLSSETVLPIKPFYLSNSTCTATSRGR